MHRTSNRFSVIALGAVMAITTLGASMDAAQAGNLRLKKNTQQHTSGGIGGYTTGFSTSCASGFSLAGKKMGHPPTWTDWYVCTTPVITCPTQMQSNGKKSGINPQAIVQIIGGDPDGGTVKFRVQYKCDYSFTPTPIG